MNRILRKQLAGTRALSFAACALLLAAGAAGATEPGTGRREDVARFRTEFLDRDRSYPDAARAEAGRRLDALADRADDVSPAAFELELARIVALADNAHTQAFPEPRADRHNRVPIRLSPFGHGFHVVRASAAHADLLGARLVAIGGTPMPALRTAAHSLAGGIPAWRDRKAAFLFESPALLHALGAIEATDDVAYRFIALDGTAVERRLRAESPDPERPAGLADRMLYPEPLAREGSSWRTLLAADRAPWSLQEPARRVRWRHDATLQALVLEMRQTYTGNGASLPGFFAAVRGAVDEFEPAHLVLDMRMNGGGDVTQARDFAESLPSLVGGRIFALTSPWTFSAAISTIGYLEQVAPDRVTIVGEPVGDRLEFFAEGRPVMLDHSGVVVLYASERHDYRNGCRAFDDCHAYVAHRPIAVPTLAPDIAAPWTIEAYRAGRDPAMEAVGAALKATAAQ